MKQNLSSKQVTIDGTEYVLPPNVFWDEKGRRFRAHRHLQGEVNQRSFSTKCRTIAEALGLASAYIAQAHAERLAAPPYKVLGVDNKGRPVSLGQGIYMQVNTTRGNYQLLKIVHGTKGRGNLRTASIGLGRMGYFTKHKLDSALRKARALRQQWAREDASNEQLFQEDKKAQA